jgi:hypothetical protein
MLLNGYDGWSGWIDGILPATDMLSDAVELTSPVALSVRGCALWGENAKGPLWKEPFRGTVQISDLGDTIASYDLMFADAARGLGTVPFDKHLRRSEWFSPNRWLFNFSKAPEVKS